jgi:hypothetical protein
MTPLVYPPCIAHDYWHLIMIHLIPDSMMDQWYQNQQLPLDRVHDIFEAHLCHALITFIAH